MPMRFCAPPSTPTVTERIALICGRSLEAIRAMETASSTANRTYSLNAKKMS
jgi:hypothetical protein